jgi:hypothetical protein
MDGNVVDEFARTVATVAVSTTAAPPAELLSIDPAITLPAEVNFTALV